MKSATASAASIAARAEPLASAARAFLIFRERLDAWGLIGAVLLAGVMARL